MKNYRSYSFWLDACEDDLTPRPGLDFQQAGEVRVERVAERRVNRHAGDDNPSIRRGHGTPP